MENKTEGTNGERIMNTGWRPIGNKQTKNNGEWAFVCVCGSNDGGGDDSNDRASICMIDTIVSLLLLCGGWLCHQIINIIDIIGIIVQ